MSALPLVTSRAMRFAQMARRTLTVLGVAWVATSCIDQPVSYAGDDPPRFVERPLSPPTRPIVALVLGSGGPRTVATIGVLKALEDADIRVDLIVGTSGGAIIGALFAHGYSAQEIAELAVNTSPLKFIDPVLSDYGYIRGVALEAMLDQLLDSRRIEDLRKPFAVVATHVETGALEIFNRGHAATAIRASAAIPGVFFPVRIDGEHYVDGEISSPVPIRVARRLGADVVIAVDVMAQLDEAPALPRYPAEWLSYGTMRRRIVDLEADDKTVLVQPAIGYNAGASQAYRARLIAAGEEAGRNAIQKIKVLIDEGTAEKQARFEPPHTTARQHRGGTIY